MLTRHREPRSEIVGLLDIGSSKICCLIVERVIDAANAKPSAVRLLGMGHQRARGVKAGYISDMDQAEAVVRTAISQAEEQAGVTLEDVVVNVTCGRMRSVHFMANADLETGSVRPDDLARLSNGAYAFAERDGRTVVHMNRVAFLLDGVTGVRQPLRMAGRRLSAQYHAVTVDEPALQNLKVLVSRTYLNIRQFVPTGFASALATLTEEERRFGAICIDIGSGTSNIALIAEDRFQCAEVVPFGSGILTYDIAKSLSAPLAEAERIKTLYGTMIPAGSDDLQPIGYALAGDDEEAGDTTRAELRRVVYPRMLNQLNLLRERLEANDLLAGADYSVVLTGGASLLLGLPAIAADVFQRPVRLGRARLTPGMPDVLRSPAFACVAGLAQAAAVDAMDQNGRSGVVETNESYIGRVTSWLKESF